VEFAAYWPSASFTRILVRLEQRVKAFRAHAFFNMAENKENFGIQFPILGTRKEKML